MAITINIYYHGKRVKEFAKEMMEKKIVDQIRNEEGNLRYDYFFPLEDEDTLLLIDSWKDQKSLDLHHQSPMMKEISELREKYDLHMEVERYLLDESSNHLDQSYIRK